MKNLVLEERTIIFYESPYRLVKTLRQLSEFLGKDRKAAVVRELTKMFEECKRGSLVELADYYDKYTPKGEIVIVLGGLNQSSEEIEEEEEVDLILGREKRKKQ
jgi:16S rRNA (cytidine1402-2'-O)-methyltransferase